MNMQRKGLVKLFDLGRYLVTRQAEYLVMVTFQVSSGMGFQSTQGRNATSSEFTI